MPKILYISNTANFSKFNRPYMNQLRNNGWIVDYASMGEENIPDCDKQIKIDIARSPFSLKNFMGYSQLKKIIEENHYDIIHCHTPMGGVLARLAAKKLWKKRKVKIIYTAHGFHFYKGAPLINWLFYYPIEKYLSRFTDLLLTIVSEDYELARKVMHCPVEMINGVGVNLEKFVPLNDHQKHETREKNGFNDDDFIITVVAETNKNKNQIMLLREVNILRREIPSLKVLLIGKETLPICRNFVEINGLQENVKFLGYRKDISELTGMSNIAFSASIREGLPVNIIEAMGCGVPIVASINRGHSSLITNEINGLLFPLNDSASMINCIIRLFKNKIEANALGKIARENSKQYSIELINEQMKIYYDTLIRV